MDRKNSDRYIAAYPHELEEFRKLMKKYKCTAIDELPVNGETTILLLWLRGLNINELERFAIDAFNSNLNHIFASVCPLIFEKIN